MLDYLSAENRIQRFSRQRDGGNLAHVIYRLQVVHQASLVLTKVLSFITAMGEVRAIFAGAGTCVQDPTSFGQERRLSFNPCVAHKGLVSPHVIASCRRKSV